MNWLDGQRHAENLITEFMNKMERILWINISHWVNYIKICMFHVNAHHGVTASEQDVDNNVDRMTCSVGIGRSYFPATPIITPWTYEQGEHSSRNRSNAQPEQHEL